MTLVDRCLRWLRSIAVITGVPINDSGVRRTPRSKCHPSRKVNTATDGQTDRRTRGWGYNVFKQNIVGEGDIMWVREAYNVGCDQPTNQQTNQPTNRQGKNNMSPTTIGGLSSDNHLVDGPIDRQTDIPT
ncbi:hypothetical protein DPMN_019022 [Dreissena polymorpha]|uniref:Uncharacterized protein n=1 Tax=Dreissena polymorpha TaxID=45954 RepID=A0A9D4NHN1_DREPO|nr:hypothetical protein DPMN_019022 [Dreissena polymorpha]